MYRSVKAGRYEHIEMWDEWWNLGVTSLLQPPRRGLTAFGGEFMF